MKSSLVVTKNTCIFFDYTAAQIMKASHKGGVFVYSPL